jgi:CRISPR-associated protein Cas5d
MPTQYTVQLEIAGPLAMFSRPDTGGTPTSFPAPTWSASKGLFESIAFFSDGAAYICPTHVEICRRIGDPGGRIQFQRYTTNYGGPLRKASLFGKGSAAGGSSMQLFATVLGNVCYRLHGVVVGPRHRSTINARHYLKDLFDRRLRRGQCFRTPCLGWSEFTCSYWGPFRKRVMEIDDALTLEVPSMLATVWNRATQGAYSPAYRQGVRINRGVLEYSIRFDLHANGLTETANA